MALLFARRDLGKGLLVVALLRFNEAIDAVLALSHADTCGACSG